MQQWKKATLQYNSICERVTELEGKRVKLDSLGRVCDHQPVVYIESMANYAGFAGNTEKMIEEFHKKQLEKIMQQSVDKYNQHKAKLVQESNHALGMIGVYRKEHTNYAKALESELELLETRLKEILKY